MGDGESAAAAAAAATDLCNPCEEARNPSAEDPVRGDEPSSSHQCGPAQEKDDSMLVGPPAAAAVPADGGEEKASAAAAAVPAAAAAAQATEMATAAPAPAVQVVERTEKRKRGRPPRGQVRVTPPKKRRDEEDVCFICFDGGKLVLCDRRGCPKAYHPTCIKRDEAFFRSKAQWNCGWHICSICEKAAHFMCYTCTYSLCKVCISEAEFLCVRGTKGFCTTCMKMVLLIENCMQGDKEMVQVDFDDKSNWEYLFKVYWIYLKGKLSLTIEEVTKAKNPWKGVGILSCKGESSGELYDASNEKGFTSDGSSRNMVGRMTKRRRIKNRAKFPRKGGTGKMVNIGVNASKPSPEGAEWASKELLDFVAYMKNGDASVLSQFDVQALVLDYVKTNNLRDPRRKSQIICDVRLGNLFGKARVGHMEMLKLLEFHFPVKEKSVVDHMKGGIPNVFSSQVDPEGNNDCKLIINNDKGCKKRKKSSRGRQTNLDDFAAIDVHNINLIYLRRGLMENLIGDAEKFSDKVVGAIVRIRISSIEQKQDLYRLVQVVGISKAAVPYTIGLKTADVMLEILNLDKKEAISIDAISNQEFSEDECGRLRQSIKGGLSKRLTVGEIQKKAMALREVKLIDCLESEILRLSHLRDRASEKGRRKELRECVEKLKLLSTPEERSRRLQEIPEVHTDPSMGLTNDSEGSTREPIKSKQELFTRSRISSMGGEQMSPQGGTDISHNTASRLQNKSELSLISYQQKELVFGAHGRVDELSQNLGRDACRTKNLVRPDNQVDLTDSVAVDLNVQDVLISESSSDAALEALASGLSAELSASAECVNDKIWHYEDPNGKKQGPFCMVQLEKWKTTGYFPPDLKVWRTSETKEDSVLLTDALDGIYHKHKAILLNSYLHSREVSVERETNLDKKGEDINSAENDSVQNKGGIPSPLRCQEVGVEQGNNLDRKAEDINSAASGSVQNKVGNWNDPIAYHNADGECPRNEEQCPRSVWNIPAGFANLNEQHDASFSRALDLLGRSNSWPDQPLMHDSLPSPTLLGKPCETMLQHGREGIEGKAQSSGQDHEKQNSHRSTVTQTTREQNNERTSNSPGHSGQSLCGSPSGWDFNSSAIRSSDTSQQHTENKYPDFPNPTPNHCDLDGKDQIAENKPSVASNAPVQDSGLSWSTASSLVANGAQHPEAAGEWNGYSSNPAKPSVEEWDSGLPSAPLLRLSEAAIDLASTPTSNSGQLTHSSTIHDTSNWQAIVSGPHDFTSLAEESVSDLLAEVDAMELNGLPSPTSIMNCGEEFTQASKSDCFNSIEVLSPSLEPGKSDALSSTGDLQIPFKSTMLDEPQGLSRADSLAVQGRSSGQSPTSAERECEAKHSDASVNQWDTGSKAEAPGRSNTGWDVPATDIAWGAGSDTADNGSGRVQAKADAVRGETVSGNSNMSWGTVPGTVQENANRSHDHSVGFPGMLGGHSRHGSGEKFSFLRDRVRDSSFARGRPSWNRQSSFGGGGSSRPLPKGQRVCKFYENGYCRKGSLCDYLHPRD